MSEFKNKIEGEFFQTLDGKKRENVIIEGTPEWMYEINDENNRNLNILNDKLKKLIVDNSEVLEDNVIDEAEWTEVYDCIPEELLDFFFIGNFVELKFFLLPNLYKNKKLTNKEIELIVKDFEKDSGWRKLFDNFQFYTDEDLAILLKEINKNFEIDYLPAPRKESISPDGNIASDSSILTRLVTLPNSKELLALYAKKDPEYFVYNSIKWIPQNFLPEIAKAVITSPNIKKKEIIFLRDNNIFNIDPGLKDPLFERQLRRYNLLTGLIEENLNTMSSTTEGMEAWERMNKINKIYEDPSLLHIQDINIQWIEELLNKTPNFPYATINTQAVIARNLFFRKKSVNKKNVQDELHRLQEMRDKYANMPLFKEREVIILAHGEIAKDSKNEPLYAFGKDKVLQQIRSENPTNVTRYRNHLEPQKMKTEMLIHLEKSNGPLTFIFDGHGGPDGLYLNDGSINEEGKINKNNDTVKISVLELFASYKIRKQNSLNRIEKSPDIFINKGCYSANFIRKFYDLCDRENILKPIFLGESEYGQYGYSYRDRRIDNYYNLLLTPNGISMLGSIMYFDSMNPNSNPSLYIPDENNVTMQLSQKNINNKLG